MELYTILMGSDMETRKQTLLGLGGVAWDWEMGWHGSASNNAMARRWPQGCRYRTETGPPYEGPPARGKGERPSGGNWARRHRQRAGGNDSPVR